MAGEKVLVVEDNPMNMELISDILNALGYEVVQTTTGTEALKLVN